MARQELNTAIAPPELSLEVAKQNYFVTAVKENWISMISLALFLAAWEAACRLGWIPEYQLLPPSSVLEMFISKLSNASPDGALLHQHALASLGLALTGFVIAIVIGVPLGLFMGWYQPVNLLVRPLFDAIRPIPPIAWIPLAIIWLGIGVTAKAFIIFLAAFVPSVINSYTGIRLTNPVLIRVAQIYGASDWEIFLKIGVPSAIPMVFTGIKLSLNVAWMALVAAELLAASVGLGYMIQMGRRLGRPDVIIVGMLTIGFLGVLLSWGLTKLEARFASSKRLT